MLPIIALIGRPNVGKSSLFNRLVRRNQAITHDLPGVTRDRIYGEMLEDDLRMAVIDTGGMLPEAREEERGGIDRSVCEQAEAAMAEADVLLFVVDGREGLTGLDESVAERVRSAGKKVLLVVNKVDGEELETRATGDFHSLGFDMLPVSAAHGYGLADLRGRVAVMARPFAAGAPEDGPELGLKLCLLGRPNAGKSSLVNALVGEARQIVSSVAGTTRDVVDVGFVKNGRRYTFVDTAGVRRRTAITDSLEQMSVYRALAAGRRADVTILVLDASQGLSHQDKRLIAFLAGERTPFLVAVNKVDLVPPRSMAVLRENFEEALRFCRYVPVLYVSALRGTGVRGILPLAEAIHKECLLRVGTGALNRAMAEAMTQHQPPVVGRRRAKFYYLTQSDSVPPEFVFFVNDAELVTSAYARYLEGQLRKRLGITKAPLATVFRSSHEKKEPERPGKGRTPRLGRDRREMEAAEKAARASHAAVKAAKKARNAGSAAGPGKTAKGKAPKEFAKAPKASVRAPKGPKGLKGAKPPRRRKKD